MITVRECTDNASACRQLAHTIRDDDQRAILVKMAQFWDEFRSTNIPWEPTRR